MAATTIKALGSGTLGTSSSTLYTNGTTRKQKLEITLCNVAAADRFATLTWTDASNSNQSKTLLFGAKVALNDTARLTKILEPGDTLAGFASAATSVDWSVDCILECD